MLHNKYFINLFSRAPHKGTGTGGRDGEKQAARLSHTLSIVGRLSRRVHDAKTDVKFAKESG